LSVLTFKDLFLFVAIKQGYKEMGNWASPEPPPSLPQMRYQNLHDYKDIVSYLGEVPRRGGGGQELSFLSVVLFLSTNLERK
jgi:hypothetical protein